jgi:hypothetical protein
MLNFKEHKTLKEIMSSVKLIKDQARVNVAMSRCQTRISLGNLMREMSESNKDTNNFSDLQ